MSDLPMITIVSATFNASELLGRTADSIRAQTYPHLQWIVADGGSTDGTLDLIKANADIVDVWFSGKDEGIYDAWNKALLLVKGEWVQFLGAGDELADPDTFARLSVYLADAHPSYDIVYGRIRLVSEIGRKPLEEIGKPWEEMKGRWSGRKPMLPVHPEVFHHASILQGDAPFDRRFRIAGDSHFLLKHLLEKDPLYVPLLIDLMPVGGVSDKIASAWKVACEISRINRDLGIRPPIFRSLMDWTLVLGKTVLSRILPREILFRIGDVWRVCIGKKRRFAVD